MNKIIMIGNLTKDPELKYAAGSGTAVTRITLAVNRPYKKDEVDFINCLAFGKTAETMSNYLAKGSKISIEGHIQTGSYTAQDGTKRYTTDVVIEKMEFLSKAKKSDGTSAPASEPAAAPETIEDGVTDFGGVDYPDDIVPVDDEDMPF